MGCRKGVRAAWYQTTLYFCVMKHDKCKEGGFLFDAALEEYAREHTTPESPLLYELNRQTHLQVLMPRMLSGHLQGAFLAMMVRLAQPTHIVELGTFTGYATLAMAEAMPAACRITTIEKHPENAALAREFFAKSAFSAQIHLLEGDAAALIPSIATPVDFAFIDADKRNNLTYYQWLLPKIVSGGIILIDNVLWDGKVLAQQSDKETEAIKAFNDFVQEDKRVENLLLPLRDGIMMVRKR